LYSEFKNGVNTGGAIQYVWMFGIIGMFVLVLACINFINLSTARSEKRAKEVGIRKTLGSRRIQLIIQFFSESLLTVSCAFVLSLLLVQISLPFFNEMAAKEISVSWAEPRFWLMCAGFILFTAVIAITWKNKPYTVIGVVSDMIMESPYAAARPIVYNLEAEGSLVLLKINRSVAAADAIARIGIAFKKINPKEPFEYRFVDDEYATKFGEEERISKLSGFFAALAIAISCLGLLGLTLFVAEQRRKEIGVRKVLGASVLNIWNLLSKEFIGLMIISFIISVPLSYYFVSGWLQNYHYRTEASWWVFAAAGICIHHYGGSSLYHAYEK